MRLSRLHIAGFKSFPDRAELGFDHGVTAIVGPNGCGKSNVVDAITWVLGEQSAKSLRGERMEDVIFNGSEARKPTAAAEVRLKFTQVTQTVAPPASPAAEPDPLLDEQPVIARDVEIGRRLYRSGESEYLIDGEICRLRDIHDLLMDSGLGVKAYAVIEQGKIGQILSSRPAERRMLIEEAAGVTKYKSRRRAAELKLEAAQQNLTRVDDIVFEVEKQRGALKRQAARARRYKRLREELRKWEQVQLAQRYETLAQDIAAADERLEGARAREVAAAARVAELEAALEALRLGLLEAEQAATAAREQAHALELTIGRREQQIQFDGRQTEELARLRESHAAEVATLESRQGPAAAAIEAQRETVRLARETLEAARAQVEDRETDYMRAVSAVQEVEQTADATRASVLAASATLSALSQARDHAAAVRDRVAAERERFELEVRELDAEAARVRQSAGEIASQLAQARAEREETAASRLAAEEALATARREREGLVQALAAREREQAGHQARLRSLEELEQRRATFGDAARIILAEAAGAVQHQGAVADYLTVERSYERAVDALLGDLLQHVIVEQPSDVDAALRLIDDRNAGRCGFVVLGDVSGGGLHDDALVVPPGARSLRDVVRATGPHAAVLNGLLGQALVVESLDAARSLARTVRVPVATTSGEVCRGAWLVEGGSHQGSHGILETRAEILGLRDQVAATDEAIRALGRDRGAADVRIREAQALVESLVASQHQREKAIVGLEAQTSRLADEGVRVGRRLELVTAERTRAEEEHATAEQRREEAVAAIAAHEGQMRVAEENLGSVMARLQAAREAAEARMRLVTEARTEQATLVERASGFDAELSRLEMASRELQDRIEGRRRDIADTDARVAALRAAIDDNTRALDEDGRALDGLRVALREGEARVSELRVDFNGRDQAIRGARHQLDAVKSEVLQSEVARATATADLTHLGATCVESMGLSLDEVTANVVRMREAGELTAPSSRLAAQTDEEEDDAESADLQADSAAGASPVDGAADAEFTVDPDGIIVDLRRKIEKLGPVNMMAIEQFDELESRHLFLTTQRKDLLDSIAQTGEAIRKIDKTTRERFAEAFELINRNFEKTFTTLFGGGRAGLVLIDQENDQESGIDIIAQPPGKRLQNVQLLSGGEKALTAMALMFAVFKHRPSPFCLLDEIDAPLDDANIGRFVEMLQGMQEHTQFILITHNRKTMEIADRLYGVTMEEPGVSKLISLQLN